MTQSLSLVVLVVGVSEVLRVFYSGFAAADRSIHLSQKLRYDHATAAASSFVRCDKDDRFLVSGCTFSMVEIWSEKVEKVKWYVVKLVSDKRFVASLLTSNTNAVVNGSRPNHQVCQISHHYCGPRCLSCQTRARNVTFHLRHLLPRSCHRDWC